jgi:hypothetical protein
MFKCPNFYGNKAHKCICPLFLLRKLKRCPTFIGSVAIPAHSRAFPGKCRPHFSYRRVD